jgi:hypothetical protein
MIEPKPIDIDSKKFKEAYRKALEKRTNDIALRVLLPGMIVEQPSGARYRIDEDGSWRRINKEQKKK